MSEIEKKKNPFCLGTKIRFICFLVLIFVALIAGFKLSNIMYERKQPEITTAFISEKIDSVSDLITAELEYKGLVFYSDGEIPFITKKEFSMIYSAHIRAGVDASKIQIEITEDKVVVTVPDAKIQSMEIDPDSIEFYDERYALLNWTKKEDVVDAISLAKEDAITNANTEELISKAREQATVIITNILSGSIGDRVLVIE